MKCIWSTTIYRNPMYPTRQVWCEPVKRCSSDSKPWSKTFQQNSSVHIRSDKGLKLETFTVEIWPFSTQLIANFSLTSWLDAFQMLQETFTQSSRAQMVFVQIIDEITSTWADTLVAVHEIKAKISKTLPILRLNLNALKSDHSLISI